MRLFVGMPVPVDLAAVTADLPGGRPVPPGSWHITLRFIGEADPAPVAQDLARGLDGASAPHVRVAGVGAFQSPAKARVAWAGVQGDLADLHARVGAAGDFVPHVTLARLRSPTDVRAWVAAHRDDVYFEGVLDEVVLFQSVLGPGGPTYTRAATFSI